MMVDGLKQMLPLDRRRWDGAYVVHTFAGLALEDEILRKALQRTDDELTGRVATAPENGKECGEVPTETDTSAHGYALVALTRGLAVRLLASAPGGQRGRGLPPAEHRRWASDSMARVASDLCPGECRRVVAN